MCTMNIFRCNSSVLRQLTLCLGLYLVPVAPAAFAQFAENVLTRHQAQADQAIDRGLAYLASVQKANGTFEGSRGESCGIVGLAGMTFLAKGHTPGLGPYGDHLNRCIDHILAVQKDNGMLNRDGNDRGMYSHNIATLFLSEVSGMVDPVRQQKLDAALSKALGIILKAQSVRKDRKHAGGWRYEPTSGDSDLSCSGWALMALRSAKLNGANVPDKAIEDAVAYLFKNHDSRTGKFGYQDANNHHMTLTGAALLCLELCGQHGTEVTFKSGNLILSIYKQLPRQEFPHYGIYYNAQGMFQLGGEYWETYANWMYETLLSTQKEDGSWDPKKESRVYATSMMVLSLAVPYRQLPIYQRDETVDEE